MNKTIIVLAAGIGSRYGGLKQMDPVGPSGEFIIDYSIYDAVIAGFDKVVFVIRRDMRDSFHETIGSRVSGRIAVDYVFQEIEDIPGGFSPPPDRVKPWGTGHALLACRNVVRDPFAIINADDFYGRDSFFACADFMAEAGSDDRLYGLIGFKLQRTLSDHGSVARGVCETNAEGLLVDIVEHTSIERDKDGIAGHDGCRFTGDETVSMNLWVFEPSIFKWLETSFVRFLEKNISREKSEFFLPTVVNDLVKAGEVKVRVVDTPSTWFGVTYREDRKRTVERIRDLVGRGIYPEDLRADK